MQAETTIQSQQVYRDLLFRSALYAVIAYFTAYLFEMLLMTSGAFIFKYYFELTYNKLVVHASRTVWSQESVMAIYLFPSLLSGVLIVILYYIIQNQKSKPGYTPLFLMWLMYFLSFRVIGMAPLHFLFRNGLYHAFLWLYLGRIAQALAGVAALIIFFMFSIKVLKSIYFFTGMLDDKINTVGNHDLIMSSFLIPLFITTLAGLLFFLPFPPVDELSGLGLVILPALYCFVQLKLNAPPFLGLVFIEGKKRTPWLLFAIGLAMIISARIILGFGISGN